MLWGWGRGWRWWYYATGLPGWVRASYGLPAYGRGWGWPGNPFGFCRWFPWLPNGWWTGIYGPVYWTPQGPVLASQPHSTRPTTQFMSAQFPQSQQMTKEQEIQYLEQERKALEQEKKAIEQELESIRKRIEELKNIIKKGE